MTVVMGEGDTVKAGELLIGLPDAVTIGEYAPGMGDELLTTGVPVGVAVGSAVGVGGRVWLGVETPLS